jgi:cellulose synthase/poly-beta-1,6-N-acetylglucosamine synthase-like glycosyltransferase
MMTLVFWISFALIGYTYVIYPVTIWVASKVNPALARFAPDPSATDYPTVSICIAARNEAHRLPQKIANLRSQTYPQEKLEIIVASDGSSDDTVQVLQNDPGVVILDCAARGKAAAINRAAASARGSILVLTDARQGLNEGAVSALVAGLRDPRVGVVSGELVHADPDTRIEASIGLYWRYEKWIRRAESSYFSMVGASGALYAMRRLDFQPLREGTILDDFEAPMAVLRKGKRIVFEDRARAYDVIESSLARERRRKIRTLAGNWQSLALNPWLLAPGRNPVLWQYVSHKLCRLVVPFALAGALTSAWLAEGFPYRIFAIAQSVFWVIACAGSSVPRLQKFRLISVASLFLELNLAAIAGLAYFCVGKTGSLWKPAT